MNNLHRELAPISDDAWVQIEREASRTFKRHLAARRVVDVPDPKGLAFSGVGTGHLRQIAAPGDDIQSVQREVKALVELCVPFKLSRQQVDDVGRGAADSDWSSVKDAAKKIAFAEDRAVFEGYEATGIQGLRRQQQSEAGASNQRQGISRRCRAGGRSIAACGLTIIDLANLTVDVELRHLCPRSDRCWSRYPLMLRLHVT